jgi:hypothetical protein
MIEEFMGGIITALLFVDMILLLSLLVKKILKKPNKLKKAHQELLTTVSELSKEKEMLIKELDELEEKIESKNLAFKKLFGGETQ